MTAMPGGTGGGEGHLIPATFEWLTSHVWDGATPGILTQSLTHLGYCAVALVLALAVGLPAGLLIGHTGRGRRLLAFLHGLRFLPSVGVLVLLAVLAGRYLGGGDTGYLVATQLTAALVAVPPILLATCVGVESVDPAVRAAARGLGMTTRQALLGVALPHALPMVVSGLRSATMLVVSLTTVAAYVTLDGLVRFVYDGLAERDHPQATGGALLVCALAVVLDALLALAQRYTVPRGLLDPYDSGIESTIS